MKDVDYSKILISRDRMTLLSILLIALIARIWGISYGFPNTESVPDESTVVNIAVKFGTGDLNPRYFLYPTLYMYSLFVLFGGYFIIGFITGRYTDLYSFSAEFVYDPTNFYLIGRFYSVILGTVTVLAVYVLVARNFDRRYANIAALYMGLSYLSVRESHFAKTDSLMVFLVVCSTIFVIEIFRGGKGRMYIAAGFISGLAVSAKYTAVFLLPALFIAHLLRTYESGFCWRKLFFDRYLILAMLISVFAFFLGTPYAVLDATTFITHGMRQFVVAGSEKVFPYIDIGWWYHLRFSLFYGLGPGIISMALIGLVVGGRKHPELVLVVFSFAIIYYIVVGSAQAVFTRYMLPIVPFVCVAAGIGTGFLVDKLGSTTKNSFVRAGLLLGITGATVVPSALRVVQFNSLIAQRDTRNLALEWVMENVPAKSTFYQVGDRSALLPLPPTLESLRLAMDQAESENKTDTVEYRTLVLKYAEQERRKIEGFSECSYDEASGAFQIGTSRTEKLPDYIILTSSPLSFYTVPHPSGLEAILSTSYEQVVVFTSAGTEQPNALYDQQDALYVPFAGFDGIERPGPDIRIYRVRK